MAHEEEEHSYTEVNHGQSQRRIKVLEMCFLGKIDIKARKEVAKRSERICRFNQ